MDFPVTFQIFGKTVLAHPVFETLGIFLGMRYYFYLKKRSTERLSFNTSAAVLIGATAGALIGSKLIGNLESPYVFFENFDFKRFWTNNTIVGGLAFGLIGVELAKKKASEIPVHFGTDVEYGCPYDCGLCVDHEQHSCLSIVEVTDRCNLTCPTCYAMSSPHYGSHRTLQEIEAMFDIIVKNEGEPDVVQISGGEPTIHPEFFKIMDIAKTKPIKHLMLNTNGIRIANDPGFAEKLATYAPEFEIYLQFDSFKAEVLEDFRGKDLTNIRMKALEKLNELNLSTTLVIVLQKGKNIDEIGKLIEFALKQKCVRGITFQPVEVAGRNRADSAHEKITLTEVRQEILNQFPLLNSDDIIPVPCNPDALAMGYILKLEGETIPLTRYINPADLLNNETRNTIVYEQDTGLQMQLLDIFSTGISVDKVQPKVNQLLCCLPEVSAPNLDYDNLFRIIIMNFMDAHDFDVRAVKKSCVHIVNKDLKMIPFETMNLFYRDDKSKYLKS